VRVRVRVGVRVRVKVRRTLGREVARRELLLHDAVERASNEGGGGGIRDELGHCEQLERA
jgi:hypothetical protein